MSLLVLERSLVCFHSTTESKMWDVAEKEWFIIPLSHSCVAFLIVGIDISLAQQWDSLKI